jgi:hypothetical protein
MICCTTVKSKTRFFLPPPLSSHNPSFDQFHVAPFSYLLKFSKFSKQNQAMMFISSKTCRFALVLAAASSIAVTAVLRGNAPTTNDATPVESLANEHGRRLMAPFTGSPETISVKSGAGLVFTHPATDIYKGDVCASSAFTGLESTETTELDYSFLDGGSTAYTGGCPASDVTDLITGVNGAMKQKGAPIVGEMGGKTFKQGIYFSDAITVAANTVITLDGCDGTASSSCSGGLGGSAMFLFQSGSYLVTGANTQILLTGGAQAKNVLFATIAAATTGAAGSIFRGSLLAGAAITLGAGSIVEGYVHAADAVTAGAGCQLNSLSLTAVDAKTPIQTVITTAVCPTAALFTCTYGCSDSECVY